MDTPVTNNCQVCVYDEGHVLKNPKSQRYEKLVKIPASFRLLLTGTPLQNNLLELAALLGFILPEIFRDRQEELDFIFKHKASTRDSDHAALLSSQRIARAKSMLTPFVLRRKKDQVLKHMPIKSCRVEYCVLHPSQAVIYEGLREKARERARLRLEGVKVPMDGENNPLMQLRKAAIHAMLFRRHFTDEKVVKMLTLLKKHEPEEFPEKNHKHLLQEMMNLSDWYLHIWCQLHPCISKFDVPNLEWMNSGKVAALVKLLEAYKENGDRVLIFSQFTLVLDILEAVLETSRIDFTRIDGGTKVNERQTLIDNFRDDKSITAFLLSTGAGGTGLNLMFANKVVIFDSSFNPQDDVQAENRAHRVGQTRDVEVVRLVTKGTIEEQIYALGQSKLALDSKVAGNDDVAMKGEEMVAKMLLEEESKADSVMDSKVHEPEREKEEGDKKENKRAKTDVADPRGPPLVRRAKQETTGKGPEEEMLL
jgi:SWI/SNF-related matrix-associated actin-dependent regulator 1 of chromatin subfamily A